MPVGAGSIKRAAKLNAEGNKTVPSKKNETEEKVEVKNAEKSEKEVKSSEDKKEETKEADSKVTTKKTTGKKVTNKNTTAGKATKKKVVKETENGPKRLGSEPACHFTEEMPIHLL